jgi:hypothetical protein
MSSPYGGGTPDPDRPNLEKGTEPTVPINQPPQQPGPPPQQGWPQGGPGYPQQPPPGQQGPGQQWQGGQWQGNQWPGQQPVGSYGYGVPDHPKATMSLVLGILGLVLCQVVAPFAWVTGKRTVQEIDAARGMLGGRSQAQAGYILGIVGTVLLGLALLLMVFYVVLAIAVFGGSVATS